MSIDVQLADGTTLQFPDGTKDAVIDKAVKQHVNVENIKRIQAERFPTMDKYGVDRPMMPSKSDAPDARTGMQVASDQAANVLSGIPQAITGIPAAIGAVGSATLQSILGNQMQAGKEWGDIGKGIADPFVTAGSGAIDLAAGTDMAPAPDNPRWTNAAQAGGEMLGGAALPNVLSGIKQAAAVPISRAGQAAAENLYGRSLKPSTTLKPEVRQRVIQTGLKEGIPTNRAGYEKAGGIVQDLNSKIQGAIDAGAGRGEVVNPSAVASRVDQILPQYAEQVNPASDVGAVESSRNQFLQQHQTPGTPAVPPSSAPLTGAYSPGSPAVPPADIDIPVDAAQRMKVGTYKNLGDKAYKGEQLKPADVAAQKALARGLAEEIAAKVPEVKDLNARESLIFELEPHLERAIARTGNHQLVGLGTEGAIIAGKALTGSGVGGAAIGGLRAILDNPAIRSRMAIAIAKHLPSKTPLANSTAAAVRLNAVIRDMTKPGDKQP